MSDIIFGKNACPKITNISIKDNKAHLFVADGNDTLTAEIPFKPWALNSKSGNGTVTLKGNQHYKYLKHFDTNNYQEWLKEKPFYIWTPRTMAEGFMILEGYTYFKEMKVNDVSLLSFDIESTTLDKNSSKARVVLFSITYRDRLGNITKKLFKSPRKEDETKLFKDVEDTILKLDPDILIGHNILSYDLPYLDVKNPLYWGRDGSPIKFEDRTSKIRKDGSQSYEFFNATCFGREIVDTFFLSIKYDIGRAFPSYGLKVIEKHLNLVSDDREEWDFSKYPTEKVLEEYEKGNLELWNRFCKYAEDDADSPIKMFDIMAPSFFYFNQNVPKTFQQMVNEASGSQLDSIMIRSYIQNGNSVPKSSDKAPYEGAISMGIPGVYENALKVDVASLYPSIMLQYDIYDKTKDPERNMLKILEYFRKQRLENKKLAEDTGDRYYDDLQNSQKIAINSMYGFLGAGYLLFNYPQGSADVTKYGREILLKGVQWATGKTLEKTESKVVNAGTEDERIEYEWKLGDIVEFNNKGYELINTDTDSFMVTNGQCPTKESFKTFINELNSVFPSMIEWADDGVYDKVIVLKAKNYILQKNIQWAKAKDIKDGKVKLSIKGGSLKDSKKEVILKEFMDKLINSLVYENINYDSLVQIYDKMCKGVLTSFEVKKWCVKKTVTGKILNPERPHEQKPYDAIQQAIKAGVIAGVQEGDKLFFYQALDGFKQASVNGELVFSKKGEPKMVENTIMKVPELWTNDHDLWHYVQRVYDTLEIFDKVLDMSKFNKYHLKGKRNLLCEM